MKVLHIVSDLGQGGAQSYVCDLLKCHQQMGGIESEVIALFFKGSLWERVERLGISIECLELRNALDVPGIIRLYKRLKLSDHDIIQVHAIHPVVSALVGRLNSKNIYMEHGGGLLGGDWREKLIYLFFQKNYCRFISISQHMKKVMRDINPALERKISVIHNGVDIERIDTSRAKNNDDLPGIFNESKFRVGIIGRLVPQKGISTFLQVTEILAQKRDDIVFPIIGDGPLRSNLEAEAYRLRLQDRVIFMGFRADAISILKHFDVFLFTSDYEPFGIVLTEAMAAGIPVVALDHEGAVSEIIDDGIDGFIVKQKNFTLLAEKVLALLENSSLSEQIRQNAQKKVAHQFTMKENAIKVYELYQECLKNN